MCVSAPEWVSDNRLVMSDSATTWTIACQAPLSMEFSRQEYWSRLPFPSPVWAWGWPQMKCKSLCLPMCVFVCVCICMCMHICVYVYMCCSCVLVFVSMCVWLIFVPSCAKSLFRVSRTFSRETWTNFFDQPNICQCVFLFKYLYLDQTWSLAWSEWKGEERL